MYSIVLLLYHIFAETLTYCTGDFENWKKWPDIYFLSPLHFWVVLNTGMHVSSNFKCICSFLSFFCYSQYNIPKRRTQASHYWLNRFFNILLRVPYEQTANTTGWILKLRKTLYNFYDRKERSKNTELKLYYQTNSFAKTCWALIEDSLTQWCPACRRVLWHIRASRRFHNWPQTGERWQGLYLYLVWQSVIDTYIYITYISRYNYI